MGLDPHFNRVDSVLLELPYDGLMTFLIGFPIVSIGASIFTDNEDACVTSSITRKPLEGAYCFTNKGRMPQIAAYAKSPMRFVVNNTSYSNEDDACLEPG
ncbi:hypothetical protein ACHAXR_012180 [Thalassiosira sp. AJA248-18]